MLMVPRPGNLEAAFIVGQVVEYMPLYEPLSVPMPKRWYIRRTAPNRELKVMRRAQQLGLSCYLPTLRSRREIRRAKAGYEWMERKHITGPLITGCILVPDFDPLPLFHRERTATSNVDSPDWKSVDGAFGLLRFGEFVPVLTPKMLCDIRRIEAIGNTPKSKREHYFKIGQLVRVLSGPFKDFSGRVERFDSTGRLSVGVDIFSRITPAMLDESDIEAV